MPTIRILLADDHAMFREGLTVLIDGQSDMSVVGQAGTGREAVDLALSARPDVAVLDVSMPDMGGAEAAESIRTRCPAVRVIALTRHSDPAYVRRLLQAGATGYVLKKSAADTLIGAIRVVAQGGTYLEPALAGEIVDRVLSARSPAHAAERDALSVREEEVLRLVAWGASSKHVATELGLSVKTVESYRASAAQKLGLRSRPEILRYAIARGWLSDEAAPE